MNSLCSISGHGFRGKKPLLPPSAITLVDTGTVTDTSVVFTWSGGLAQDANTVTTTYTLNGSGVSPSSSGTGTATFTGLGTLTVYNFVVTATNIIGTKTGSKAFSTIGLVYSYPFQNDLLDYHTGSGVSNGGLTSGNIYLGSPGWSGLSCLYCSAQPGSFKFPNSPLVFTKSAGFSVSFWFNCIAGYSDALFNVGNAWNRYYIKYDESSHTMFVDTGTMSGNCGSNILPNTWYHICWVVQANTAPSLLYVNGGSVNGGQTVTIATTTANSMSCQNNQCGVFYDYGGGIITRGSMNNLNIFNYGVTQAQVTSLWLA